MVKAGTPRPKAKGRGLIPSWAKSTFKLVSEWKKPIRTVLRNLTSSY